jgi:hypothetical protein
LLWNTGSSAFADDDNCGCGATAVCSDGRTSAGGSQSGTGASCCWCCPASLRHNRRQPSRKTACSKRHAHSKKPRRPRRGQVWESDARTHAPLSRVCHDSAGSGGRIDHKAQRRRSGVYSLGDAGLVTGSLKLPSQGFVPTGRAEVQRKMESLPSCLHLMTPRRGLVLRTATIDEHHS